MVVFTLHNMKYKRNGWMAILCVWFGFSCYSAFAQSDFNFDHLTPEDGLSESTVLAISQDPQGFIWFGTREGLNRYDGRKIKIYKHDEDISTSISDNFVYVLFTDSRGRMWVGTRIGLNLFDPETDTFRKFYSDSLQSHTLSNNTITSIFEDANKNLWVGTRQGLNLLQEQDSLFFIRFQHQSGNENSLMDDDVRSIFQDKYGDLWIGTPQGFSKLAYGNSGFAFTTFRLPGSEDLKSKSNSVNAFSEDDAGRLLIGTERNGLIFFDRVKRQFSSPDFDGSSLNAKAVRSIHRTTGGDFWIGTIGGLLITSSDFSKIKLLKNDPDNPASITDNSIRAIYRDNHGTFWIGTYHGGVNIYSPSAKQFRFIDPVSDGEKYRFKIASALTTDRDRNFWIGTEGNGLLFIDANSNLKKHFRHEDNDPNTLCHDNIKCLLLEEDQGIWIGTIQGLDYYDFRKKQFKHFRIARSADGALPDDVIYDIVKDNEGTIWVATYRGGLLRLNRKSGTVEKVFTSDPGKTSLSSNVITKLFIDHNKNLWVGTTNGLNRMNTDGTFERVLTGSSRNGNYIVSIHEDKTSQIWTGTRGNGLYRISADRKMIRNFSLSEGLPGTAIYGIQEDDHGFLWLSTENGIARFDPGNFSIKTFSRSDGLICKEFNFNSYHKDRAGFFYFGGYNGVTFFHPDSIRENKIIPTIAFTELRLFNKEVKPADASELLHNHVNFQDNVEFRYNQNIFSVEFAVLNYINSEKNRFAYKLEGFEDDWNVVTDPVVTYMNLRPGTYRLLVKGSNNDGTWSDVPRAITIRVLPPPWKSWWAYSAYVATFLALMYAWSRLNRRRVKLEHDLQLEHLEKAKQEELHQAKLNFFINIAHEIRTPVTLIAGPIEQLQHEHSSDTKIQKELHLVKTNSERLMRLVSQLLDFQKQETGNIRLKVSKGNFILFLREVYDSFREYATSRKVQLSFSPSRENIPLWFDREELTKVFYNVLVNALKFTPGGGEVKLSVSMDETNDTLSGIQSTVKIVVEDNGLGISPQHLEKIFHRFYQAENTGIQEAGFGIGLALTKGIVDLHHGNISVESREATSNEPGFTRFTIVLQTGCDHFSKDQIQVEPENIIPDLFEHSFEDPALANDAQEKPLVLLVEDNDEIRAYVRGLLSQQYQILESSNGTDGWQIAVERLPDLIISDVMMPGMSGVELVSKLKSDQRTNHIPVILLTARGSVNHQVEGLETGADDYVTKPFHNNLLLVKVRNHLAVRERLREKYSRIVTLQPTPEEIADPDDKFLQRLMAILEQNIVDSEFNVSKLVREIGMSRPVLFRKIKMLTGLSVIDLIRNVRMKKAEMLLKQKKLTISEVAFTVGFADPKYFSKSFRSHYGKTPSQFMEEL